jgi:hypothetical protein
MGVGTHLSPQHKKYPGTKVICQGSVTICDELSFVCFQALVKKAEYPLLTFGKKFLYVYLGSHLKINIIYLCFNYHNSKYDLGILDRSLSLSKDIYLRAEYPLFFCSNLFVVAKTKI